MKIAPTDHSSGCPGCEQQPQAHLEFRLLRDPVSVGMGILLRPAELGVDALVADVDPAQDVPASQPLPVPVDHRRRLPHVSEVVEIHDAEVVPAAARGFSAAAELSLCRLL